MKKYLTKNNIYNALLFIQFALVSVMETYEIAPDTLQHLSLLGLLIGYWINTNKKEG